MRGWMESRGMKGKEGGRWGIEECRGGGSGHAKGQLLVRGFYWECRREGVCVEDHRLRF